MTISQILKSDIPLNEKVKAIRKAKKLSQVELAARSGVSERMIRYLEDGSKSMSTFNIEMVLEALGYKLSIGKKKVTIKTKKQP